MQIWLFEIEQLPIFPNLIKDTSDMQSGMPVNFIYSNPSPKREKHENT